MKPNHHEKKSLHNALQKSKLKSNHQSLPYLKFTPINTLISLLIFHQNSNKTMNFSSFISIFSIFLIVIREPSLVLSSTDPLELISLLSIKSSLKDPLNTFHDWDPKTAFSGSKPTWCTWTGITCDNITDHVTTLDLSGRNISGKIPTKIKYLSHLQHLNLSRNSLDGIFEPAIFELRNLETLDINHNFFNSSFPNGVSKLQSLKFFNAYSNNFDSPLPEEFVELQNLDYLNLGGSYFEGEIPTSYGTFPKLKSLYLHGNILTGPIPEELAFLNQLEHLEIGYNTFSGGIPGKFSNLSNLVYLDISSCNLSGTLPAELGQLTKLENLFLFKNQITGSIPATFAQMESLQRLDLSDNNLSGEIPNGFSELTNLQTLHLMSNDLSGEIPEKIGELPYLEDLSLWNNSFSGVLPQKLGSNAKLLKLDVSSNSLTGPIPENLCLGDKLIKLILFSNKFIGPLPSTLTHCTALTRLRIHNNKLNGSIPFGFGSLPSLSFCELSNNEFSGIIPDDIGNAVKLEFLNVSENAFNSELPKSLWNAPSLQIFLANSAKLVGNIPNFTECRNFYRIELSGNNLSGNVPWNIGHCEKLISLDLGTNALTGIIPWEISRLPSITDVDLSHNLLTGEIPSSFTNCRTLENFNVSYNQLTGPLPSSGLVFSSLHPSSFEGNAGLCGKILMKPCWNGGVENDVVPVHQQTKKTGGTGIWIMAVAFGIGMFILVAGTRCLKAKYGKFSNHQDVGSWKLTAFQRLNFTADDVLECLDMSDTVLGMGSAGTVYKADMPDGETIAIKKLWGKKKDAIVNKNGVLAEVDVLGNVRHRNIVRLLGCCSNNRCTMLLYEYMPNGSLDDLLHGKNKGDNLVSDWVIRYKIALGVAQGICYLHHDCDPVIVHRDLKPSNILLDAEMEARVADFGVAKLIQSDELMSVIAGSYGYIAPEYAYTLQVDEKSDIYSYGVVLMEMLTGKRSVETEFGDGNSIVDWIKFKIKNKDDLVDVLDKNAGSSCALVREEMIVLLRIALLCTGPNPVDRPSMRDVVSMLQAAKPKRKVTGSDGKEGVDTVIDVRDFPEPKKLVLEC